MGQRIRDLLSRLSEDREFFASYRDTFVDNFLSSLEDDVPGVINSQTIRVLVRKVYAVLFSFRDTTEEEVFNLFYSLATHGVDIKKPLTKSLLRLVRDYIDHISEKEGNFKKVKDLIDLVDLILHITETAYSRYLRELREKAGLEEDIKADVGTVINLVEELKTKGEDVEILAYYKEVPVVCRSRILDIHDKDVTVEMCDLNIFRKDADLYLKIKNLPKTVGVKVSEVDHSAGAAKLEVLGLVDLPQERRRFVRVVPEDPVPVHVEKEDWKTVGSMADVSVGGVGVYLKDPDDLKAGDVVRVRFDLPKGTVDTLGVVRYVLERGEVYRIGVQYDLDLKQEDVVSDYVMDRQFEILRELKGL